MDERHLKTPKGQGTAGQRRPKLRCAVYTRKSSEEGLEQSFNSLDAQRDACEAYIASQKHEGWVLLSDAYDDGGLSGGSMDRPALKRLIDDIRANRVDIVVVYKVDRLTRSLADFAKLTELFDTHNASFVSVTQHFNTSTSMGRLTLNVLLSFAQFEREVAGERIRDKIALSKRRGMWMGGLSPLGYDGVDKRLAVNAEEAATVRFIYQRYLDLGSIAALKADLDHRGIVSKRRVFKDGREGGGMPISRGALHQILRNRTYCGEIAHHGEVHAGNHEAIIDEDLWTSVQAKLNDQANRQRQMGMIVCKQKQPQISKTPSWLAGLVFDGAGNRLTPSHARKGSRRYRYYVSAPLVRGEKMSDDLRIPAIDLERAVASAIARCLRDDSWLLRAFGIPSDASLVQRLINAGRALAEQISTTGQRQEASTPEDDVADLLRDTILRLVVDRTSLAISLAPAAFLTRLSTFDSSLPPLFAAEEMIAIEVPVHRLRCGKQVRLVVGKVESQSRNPDQTLIALVADAHRWFQSLVSGKHKSIAEIADKERRQVSEVSRSISLAFLAPDLVEMILRGDQPATLTPERLRACRPLPPLWDDQRALLIGD